MNLLIHTLCTTILFLTWNGLVINWQRAKVKAAKAAKDLDYILATSYRNQATNYSKAWHGVAILTKAWLTIPFIINYWGSWWQLASVCFFLANVFWIIYDLGINIILNFFQETKLLQIDTRPWSFNRILLNLLFKSEALYWGLKFGLFASSVFLVFAEMGA